MRIRMPAVCLLALAAAQPLAAQRTRDEARLSLGLAFGASAGNSLWSVARQPISDGFADDTVSLDRRTTSGLSIVFHGTYFASEHWGFTGEAMLLGLGLRTQCELLTASGSPDNEEVCNSLKGRKNGGSAVSISVGTLYRIGSRKVVSPYLRAHAGLVISQQSTVQTTAILRSPSTGEEVDYRIYVDPDRRQFNPVFGIGLGFTAALAPGYQLRWEIRDNIVSLDRVTGPTDGPFIEPPHSSSFKHIFSVTFGFDVVLERRRGRRY